MTQRTYTFETPPGRPAGGRTGEGERPGSRTIRLPWRTPEAESAVGPQSTQYGRSSPRPDSLTARPVRRRSRRADGMRPDRWALAVIGVIAVGGLALLALFWLKTPGLSFANAGEGFTTAGDGLGMLAAYLLMAQVLLMARIPWLEQAIGSDRLASVHRVSGETLVAVLLAHVATITVGYAGGVWSAVPGETTTLLFDTAYVLPAAIGIGIFVLTGILSMRVIRRRLPYELWYYLHLGVYAAIALAFAHQIVLGPTFADNRTARYAWAGAYLAVGATVLVFRVGGPLRLAMRHRLVVTAVKTEAAGTVSIYLGGRHLRRLNVEPGQYFRWRFLAPGAWWQAHPYSLSAAPNREWLRITVRSLGDHSKSLQGVREGTRVLAEGPFGTFTAALRTRSKVLLFAGGIGITPLRALADTLVSAAQDVVLVYRASDRESVVFGEELAWMAETGKLRLHYLLGSHETDPGLMSPERIVALVPDVTDRDVFLCGPPGMVDSARSALSRAGVAERRMHFERFSN